MNKLSFSIASLGLAAALSTGTAQAADIAAGKAKAEAQCAVCHAAGNDWNKTVDPSYPKLAGQHKDYLTNALNQYKSGARNNAIMNGFAGALSSDDIDDIAAFLHSVPGDLYLKK